MSVIDYWFDRVTIDCANRHIYGGKIFAGKELYEGSIKHYRKGIQMYEQLLDANDPQLANAYVDFSIVLRATGNNKEAAELCRKAIDIYAKNTGLEKDVRNAFTHLGLSYMRGGEKEKAQNAFLRAQELLTVQNENSLSSVTLSYYLGALYNDMGRHEEAWTTLTHAYDMYIASSENDPTLEAGILLSMGVNQEYRGNYQQALDYCLHAWAIQSEQKVSSNDISVTAEHVASIQEKLGEWEDAINTYRSVISIYQEGYYQKQFELLKWYKNIGLIELQHGLNSFAKDDFRRALYHAKQLKDDYDREVADIYFSLGLNDFSAGEYYTASRYFNKTIPLLQINQTLNLKELALVHQYLGDCRTRIQFSKEQPEEYYLKSIAYYHALTEDAPASLCLDCAIYLINSQKYMESLYCSQEALRGFSKALSDDQRDGQDSTNDSLYSIVDGIGQCHYNIGFVHYVNVEYVKAAQEFIMAYVWFKYTLPLKPDNAASAESLHVCEEQLKFVYELNSQDHDLAVSIFEKASEAIKEERGADSDEYKVSMEWVQYAKKQSS